MVHQNQMVSWMMHKLMKKWEQRSLILAISTLGTPPITKPSICTSTLKISCGKLCQNVTKPTILLQMDYQQNLLKTINAKFDVIAKSICGIQFAYEHPKIGQPSKYLVTTNFDDETQPQHLDKFYFQFYFDSNTKTFYVSYNDLDDSVNACT